MRFHEAEFLCFQVAHIDNSNNNNNIYLKSNIQKSSIDYLSAKYFFSNSIALSMHISFYYIFLLYYFLLKNCQ